MTAEQERVAGEIARLENENRKLMSIVLWAERRLPRHYAPYVQRMLERPFEPDFTPVVQSEDRP